MVQILCRQFRCMRTCDLVVLVVYTKECFTLTRSQCRIVEELNRRDVSNIYMSGESHRLGRCTHPDKGSVLAIIPPTVREIICTKLIATGNDDTCEISDNRPEGQSTIIIYVNSVIREEAEVVLVSLSSRSLQGCNDIFDYMRGLTGSIVIDT